VLLAQLAGPMREKRRLATRFAAHYEQQTTAPLAALHLRERRCAARFRTNSARRAYRESKIDHEPDRF
jgi:hypothetical protein